MIAFATLVLIGLANSQMISSLSNNYQYNTLICVLILTVTVKFNTTEIMTHSHTIHHNSQLRIQHLEYQNALLSQRNTALSLENEKLLSQLQKNQEKINKLELLHNSNVNSQKQQIHKLLQTQKNSLSSIWKQMHQMHEVEGFDEALQKVSTLTDQPFLYQSTSLVSLFESLTTLVSTLSQKVMNLQNNESKSKLQKIEQRLRIRKQAKIQTQRVVHFVKDPADQLLSLDYKVYEQNFTYLKDIYERIIRRTKKPDINIRNIQSIFQIIDELMKSRWISKIDEGKLVLLERKLELGQMHSTQICQLQQKLFKSRENSKHLKSQIDQSLLLLK